jgi:acyl-CoA thioesterase YciA
MAAKIKGRIIIRGEKMSDEKEKPKGDLAIRTLAMPKDTNPNGDIFGGWVLSQMDIAGGTVSTKLAAGRTVTVAVDAMTFHKPVKVGDILCCYTDIIKVGKTSITIKIETWVARKHSSYRVKVTEGIFTYVHIDMDGKPIQVNPTK